MEKRKEKKKESEKRLFLLLAGITPALRTQGRWREKRQTMSQCMSNDGTGSSQSAAAEFDVAQRGRAIFLFSRLRWCFFFLAQHTVYVMDINLNSGAARASQKNAACASWPFAARDGGQTPTLITGFGADPLPASSICHRILEVDGWID